MIDLQGIDGQCYRTRVVRGHRSQNIDLLDRWVEVREHDPARLCARGERGALFGCEVLLDSHRGGQGALTHKQIATPRPIRECVVRARVAGVDDAVAAALDGICNAFLGVWNLEWGKSHRWR